MRPGRAKGVAYLGALFAVAIVGIGLVAVGTLWQTQRDREREAELLFVGNQFRQAIGAYYRQPAAPGRYPGRLEDLLKDPRTPQTTRYLRQLYADPITGKKEWGLVRGPDGGIAGVHSLSENAPFKTANFRLRDGVFEGKKSYAEWQFVYAPTAGGAPFPATPSKAPTPPAR